MKFTVFSGTWTHWSLADALKWHMQWKCSLVKAFGELALLCADGRVFATGVLARSHPDRPKGWDFPPYEPFATPNRLPPNTPGLGRIPAEDWPDFEPVTDTEGEPTSKLSYASVKLPAWSHVEFDQSSLVEAWMPLIRETEKRKQGRGRAAVVPTVKLVEFYRTLKRERGIAPPMAELQRLAEAEFEPSHVRREEARAAQTIVWGQQRPGPRSSRLKTRAAE
jgi:hypothetical protein